MRPSAVGGNAVVIIEHDDDFPVRTGNDGKEHIVFAAAQARGVDDAGLVDEVHGCEQDVGAWRIEGDGNITYFLDKVNEPLHGLEGALVGGGAAVKIVGASLGLRDGYFLDVVRVFFLDCLTRAGHEAVNLLADNLKGEICVFSDHTCLLVFPDSDGLPELLPALTSKTSAVTVCS